MDNVTKIVLVSIVGLFAGCILLSWYGAARQAEYYQSQGIEITASDIWWGADARIVQEVDETN